MTHKTAYSPFYYFGREFICPTEEYFPTADKALDYLRQHYKGNTYGNEIVIFERSTPLT